MENKLIPEKVDRAMKSLDDIRMVDSNPYLLTRILAKIKHTEPENFWWKATQFLSRPAVITAFVFICIVFNFIALSIPQQTESQLNNNSAASVNPQNQDVSVTIAAIYDFENMEP